MNKKRIRKLNKHERGEGSVIYWMSRDQRVEDNWALICAYNIAKEEKRELRVVFSLTPNFPEAYERHYHFMIQGLREVAEKLKLINIQFEVLLGEPSEQIINYVQKNKVGALVTDFSPLKIGREWREKVANEANVAMYEVDAHNIVPVWEASEKEEFAAYTFRPKIHKKLSEFLDEFPKLKKFPFNKSEIKDLDLEEIIKKLNPKNEVKRITWIKPGEKEAKKILEIFIDEKLEEYPNKRNDPNENVLSNLSPYYHFGQLSPQRAAIEVRDSGKNQESIDAYLEELIVRRELSDNFCFYNTNYDNFKGLRDWAKKTLFEHIYDKREFIYSIEEFENAKTHDELWNAAQIEMKVTGKMHGYMRMYWAKKILEWSETPHQAIEIAIKLNDKYELDGRDPNGYVGVLWSIGGLHDRAWFEREVYGKIRYMNFNGAKRKFDVEKYISKYT